MCLHNKHDHAHNLHMYQMLIQYVTTFRTCTCAHIFLCSEVVSMHVNKLGTCKHVNTDICYDTDHASKLDVCQKAHMHLHETMLITLMHGKICICELSQNFSYEKMYIFNVMCAWNCMCVNAYKCADL